MQVITNRCIQVFIMCKQISLILFERSLKIHALCYSFEYGVYLLIIIERINEIQTSVGIIKIIFETRKFGPLKSFPDYKSHKVQLKGA